MIDLHLSAFAPRWRFLYVVRIDAYKISPKNQLPCNQQPAADLFELVALTMLYNRFAHR
jgi:hypothetical protein